MVGPGHDDHGRLRRHGAQDVRRHVRGRPVRPRRRTHDRPAGARDRQQLCDVLQSHAGASQAPEEETSSASCGAAPGACTRGAGDRRWPWARRPRARPPTAGPRPLPGRQCERWNAADEASAGQRDEAQSPQGPLRH